MEQYRYIGNCTNAHMAPHLEDMMDRAKQVSYRKLCSAVGRENLASVFSDFDWSPRPKDMTLAREPYASFYQSTFKGAPCYYVRESGIEYVFAAEIPEPKFVPSRSFQIKADGSVVDGIAGGAVFTVAISRDFNRHTGENLRAADISQSSAATPRAALTLARWLRANEIAAVVEDDDIEEWKPVDEYLGWLESVG